MRTNVLGEIQVNLLWILTCAAVVMGACVMLTARGDPARPTTVPVPVIRLGRVPSPVELLPVIIRRSELARATCLI